jgi:hypothetical protein
MNDKQQQYLDKVIKFIVVDTILDYEQKMIRFPFLTLRHAFPIRLSLRRVPSFEKYCKDIYGLTEEEVKYVWEQYKDIIKDKINER